MNSTPTKLPGEDLVCAGIADLEKGQTSDNSLLVLIAAPRLRGLGLSIPECKSDVPFEHQLYERLEERLGAGAHSHYNILIRRIVSYARCLDHERTRGAA